MIKLKNRMKQGTHPRSKTWHLVFTVICLLFVLRSDASAQDILTCPTPTPSTPDVKKAKEYPYRVSYGFKATDRNYDDPAGISKQSGTVSFAVGVTSEVEIRLANQNFVIGKDTSGSRAINFGNSAFGITYFPSKLQESTSWNARHHYPSISFDYEASLPTGRRSRGLNVGRVDHDFTIVIEKLFGEKIFKDSESFVRRNSIEADFGLSLGANDGSGYSKTGNFVLILSSVLGDIKTRKYSISSEISFGNLAVKQATSIRTLNSIKFKLGTSGKQLKLGLIAGLKKSSARVGLNVSFTFNGSFKRH